MDNERAARQAPAEPAENLLVGRNPIREALRAGRPIDKLLVAQQEVSGSLRGLLALAKERGVPVQTVDKRRLDELAKAHQGVAAVTPAFPYAQVEDILALAVERNEPPFVVLLDSITDPHNLGAILRSCECMGAHGVIIPERRTATLTPAAVKASAGAAAWVKLAKVKNLVRCMEQLKERGLWLYAADMDGQPLEQADLRGPLGLVIGAEGQGVSRLVRERCDGALSIPLRGRLSSLNASVAAGILLYEAAKQRCT